MEHPVPPLPRRGIAQERPALGDRSSIIRRRYRIIPMDAKEYITRAEACFSRVAKWLEEFDPDEVDYSAGDGALTVEFPDGGRFVLSRQSATSQIWLAAGAHGWHFNWDADAQRWVDDKDGRDLYARIAESMSEKLGRPVEFDG
jgi:CyaY protein